MNLEAHERTMALKFFMQGRERGQIEGRNELRSRLSGLLNYMESV